MIYVVACYFGKRRVADESYRDDPADYINWHIKQLEELRHDLIEKVVFACNDKSYKLHIPDKISGVDVEVIRRENIGMSYGAWNEAFQRNKSGNDFFFIEDDYVPVIDDFDRIFYSKMLKNTGFVCSLYHMKHAAISNGLMRREPLEKHGGLPHAKSPSDYGLTEQRGQVKMSKFIEQYGFEVRDISDDYYVPFLNVHGDIIDYGNLKSPAVLAPVKMAREMYD